MLKNFIKNKGSREGALTNPKLIMKKKVNMKKTY